MSLRPITLPASRAVGAPPVQGLPDLAWVAVADLRIDDRYQRPLERGNWKIIQKIADSFDWTRFSPLLVAPLPEGGYAIIDGQHRAHAAALRGIASVPALVAGIDARDQARAFAAVNGSITQVSLFHLYRAALAASEAWALDSRAAVAAAGCRLCLSNASTIRKAPREVYAIGLIRDHVRSGRGAVVTRGLAALAEDEKAGSTVACWAESVLRPWLRVVQDFPDVVDGSLLLFARQADPLKLVANAPRLADRPEFKGKCNSEIVRLSLAALMRNFIATGEAWPKRRVAA